MHTFLTRLMPTEGYYCVAKQVPGRTGFMHFWADTLGDAYRRAMALDKNPNGVFLAQATFQTLNARTQANAHQLKNFWIDIDCGKDKPYATQMEGITALKTFCDTIQLPFPSLVSSGNGLYAHWILTNAVSAPIWKTIADLFKTVIDAYGFRTDSACTADHSRVLRPVGVHHRKDIANVKPVRLLREADDISLLDFGRIIKAAAKASNVPMPLPKAPSALNAAFMVQADNIPSSAPAVAQKCSQVAHIRDTKGNVEEPLWYAAVGLLRYTVESPGIVHEWSSGHPGYSPSETDLKISQHETQNIGPTTCQHFSGLNPTLCEGCKYVGKIRTPLVLGRAEPKPLAAEEVGQDHSDVVRESVAGFTVSANGIYFNNDGTPVKIYDYPLAVVSVGNDHGECVTVKHFMPEMGWKEFHVPSRATQDSREFFKTLIDNHVQVVGKEAKGLFMAYFELMMQKVRGSQKIQQLNQSMGWCQAADGEWQFNLGAEVISKSGVARCSYGANAPDFVKNLLPHGGREEWIGLTDTFNRKGYEGLAFEFLALAFGAPLVRFTGFRGACVGVVGASGVGKTATAIFALAAWGAPESLMLLGEDTHNAMVGRLGVYKSLPAYIDEISNLEPKQVSQLAYRISEGRDKLRLDRSAREKKVVNTWQTLGVVSSNQSLMDKLSGLKGDAAAELNRIFEYELFAGLGKTEGAALADCGRKNYAVIGREYARYLVDNFDKHEDNLTRISSKLDTMVNAQPGERFWTMMGAVALYGGMIARKLGLSHVDPDVLLPWVAERIKDMRIYRTANIFDATSWLGAFLDRNVKNAVVVKGSKDGGGWDAINYRDLGSRLVYRIELDRNRCWVSYSAIAKELRELHVSITKATRMLGNSLINGNARIALGRHTPYSGVPQRCWEIDLGSPLLSRAAHTAHLKITAVSARGVKG